MSFNATQLHAMQLTDMIDGYDQCRQRKFHRCQVMSGSTTTLTNSDNDLRRVIQSTGLMVVGAWVRKSRYGDGITFGCFLVSCLLLFFGSRPGTNDVGMGFYHEPMEVEFPHAPDPPKGRH